MGAQVKLSWTNVSTGSAIEQRVEKRINDEVDWTIIASAGSITTLDSTTFEYVDTDIHYTVDTVVVYRISTYNGTYALPGNEVSVSINAEPSAVTDLSATVEVV